MLKGGGIGQPSDLPGGSHYLDPVLLHNGQPERYEGYCSDVFTDGRDRFRRRPRPARRSSSTWRSTAPTTRSSCPKRNGRLSERHLGADQFPPGQSPAPLARRRQDRPGLRDGDEHRHERRPAAERARREGSRRLDDRGLPDRQRAGLPALQRRACAGSRARCTRAESASPATSAGRASSRPGSSGRSDRRAHRPRADAARRMRRPPPAPSRRSTAGACFPAPRRAGALRGRTGRSTSSGTGATCPRWAGPSRPVRQRFKLLRPEGRPGPLSRRLSSTTSSTIRSSTTTSRPRGRSWSPRCIAITSRGSVMCRGTRGFVPVRIEVGGSARGPDAPDTPGPAGTRDRVPGRRRRPLGARGRPPWRYEVTVHVPESKPGITPAPDRSGKPLSSRPSEAGSSVRPLPAVTAQGRPGKAPSMDGEVTGRPVGVLDVDCRAVGDD